MKEYFFGNADNYRYNRLIYFQRILYLQIHIILHVETRRRAIVVLTSKPPKYTFLR